MNKLSEMVILHEPPDDRERNLEPFVPDFNSLHKDDYMVPFGVIGNLFLALPNEIYNAKIPSIYPTVTAKNDREGDRD